MHIAQPNQQMIGRARKTAGANNRVLVAMAGTRVVFAGARLEQRRVCLLVTMMGRAVRLAGQKAGSPRDASSLFERAWNPEESALARLCAAADADEVSEFKGSVSLDCSVRLSSAPRLRARPVVVSTWGQNHAYFDLRFLAALPDDKLTTAELQLPSVDMMLILSNIHVLAAGC
ncbi:hypothetical protein ABZP36_023570 [Zizania latifolia]